MILSESWFVCRCFSTLKPEDIIYNSSPLAGSTSSRKGDKYMCQPILPNFVCPEVQDVMSREKWVGENVIDLALYDEAK